MASNIFDLNGRIAVVIGGTSGIGRAIALGLAEAGAHVIPTSRSREKIEIAAREIEGRGRSTIRVTSNVSNRASIVHLLDCCLEAFGRVDILVNSAGCTRRTPIIDLPESEWSELLDTNLTGVLRACQIFGRQMLERGYGRIINIASLSSFVAFYEVAAYAASKAAVASLTKSLAVEWASRGVCVNAIAPGVFRTDLNNDLLNKEDRGNELLLRTPARRFGQVEELVGAAVLLASDAASYINGEVLVVDGGFLASGVNQ